MRTETAEAEIEVSDNATEREILQAASRLREDRWTVTDDWDTTEDTTDDYEVVKRLDTEEPKVRGNPEDFGLTQPALLAV